MYLIRYSSISNYYYYCVDSIHSKTQISQTGYSGIWCWITPVSRIIIELNTGDTRILEVLSTLKCTAYHFRSIDTNCWSRLVLNRLKTHFCSIENSDIPNQMLRYLAYLRSGVLQYPESWRCGVLRYLERDTEILRDMLRLPYIGAAPAAQGFPFSSQCREDESLSGAARGPTRLPAPC